jgi:hypothetical protein
MFNSANTGLLCNLMMKTDSVHRAPSLMLACMMGVDWPHRIITVLQRGIVIVMM